MELISKSLKMFKPVFLLHWIFNTSDFLETWSFTSVSASGTRQVTLHRIIITWFCVWGQASHIT